MRRTQHMAEGRLGINPALEVGIESGLSLQSERTRYIAVEKQRRWTASPLQGNSIRFVSLDFVANMAVGLVGHLCLIIRTNL